MTGTLISINIVEQEGGPTRELRRAELRAGRGIVGDRNYDREDMRPDQEVTLIDTAAVEAFNAASGLDLGPAEIRRNLVTADVDLNALVEREFFIGAVRLRGLELCEPCTYVAGLLASNGRLGDVGESTFVRGMTHRAGLRACILVDGTVQVGDKVESC